MVLAVLNTASATHARPSGSDSSATVEDLTRQVASALPRGHTVLIRSVAIETRPHAFGVGLQLERRGTPVKYATDMRSEVGDDRTTDPGPGATTIVFGTAGQRSQLAARARARQIASTADAVVFLDGSS
jgi:hypothetical protein